MADFWGGFGKGFAPAFETAWESAEKRAEREATLKAAQDKIDAAREIKLTDEAEDREAVLSTIRMAMGEEKFSGLPAFGGALTPRSAVIPPEGAPLPDTPVPDVDEYLGRMKLSKIKNLVAQGERAVDRLDIEEDRGYTLQKAIAGEGRAFKRLEVSREYAKTLLDNNRKYAELIRRTIKDEDEKQRKLVQLESFTMDGEKAAGRLAAAKGEPETANPHKGEVLEKGAWQVGYFEEKGALASAGKKAGDAAAAKFMADGDNIKNAFEGRLETLWGQTHDVALPADVRNAALSSWEAAKGEVGDLGELKFFQDQYQQALSTIAGAPKEYLPWDKAGADFKTNPKDLALAVRRIYGTHDAKMERLLNRKDVPYEFWNVLGPQGQFRHRTWRIRSGFKASDMTKELVDEANAVLEYEASTLLDEAGNKVPMRKTLPINLGQVIRIGEARGEKEKESGKPIGKALGDLLSLPKPLPALPGVDEGPMLKKPEPKEGGLLKKVPRRGVVPDEARFPPNPKEGDKFGPVKQGGETFNFIFQGGKWIQVK